MTEQQTPPFLATEGLDPNEKCNKLAKILMEKLMDKKTSSSTCETLLDVYTICGITPSFIVDIRTPSWMYFQTPLMAAASRNMLTCCKRLIKMGADLHATDLQGYTALHHAVLNGADKCAKFLIDTGADPNAKSESGKNCYDLGIYCYTRIDEEDHLLNYSGLFTYEATPKQQAEIYEMVGALVLQSDACDVTIEMWDKAKEVCEQFDIQHSKQVIKNNLRYLRDNEENYNIVNEEFYRRGMNTVDRLSDGNSKFWFWLKLASIYSYEIRNPLPLLGSFMSEELKRVRDFDSLEEVDFKTLFDLFGSSDDYGLSKLKNNEKQVLIENFHSIGNLIISCFNKRIRITDSNMMTDNCIDLYVKFVHVLASIQFYKKFNHFTPKFSEIMGLLKTLIKMDLRDEDENSLMHLVFLRLHAGDDLEEGPEFEPEIISFLLNQGLTVDVDVVTKNRHNQEPIQLIQWNRWKMDKKCLKLLTEMAEKGAHIDAKNARGGRTLREKFQKKEPYLSFKYDNLQCACARVLAGSSVPYRNRVPKCIAKFIEMH